ncbi:ExbD/TolR family protein [Cupriavidus agavae]|uniref:Outer membrane transport energization protein ExbD n=1 Tax=Cupriavidus agavae TaxID=1001822 RepID=A0A4Q7S8B9_9BURK|nr:biopolymer transporter ExbD [Cupriavidus agavae]RZT41662.1 outer membrane transport energization protein ExbD [Cupriavidus agavae]
MAFGTLDGDDDEVMSEINMTPLVDVMLVLLIIFIITIPVINHAVKIDLPRATNQPNDTKPVNINVSVDAQGKVFWNQEEVDQAQLEQRIAEASQLQPQPELHLRADRDVKYEFVAQVMAAAQHGGLGKIGFITEPKR